MLKDWQDECTEMEAEQLAHEAGYYILVTQPCYSGFQTIELVLSIVKGTVAREYKKHIKFQEVRTRLEQQFHFLDSEKRAETISRIIQYKN